jgi:hypothetical protein
MPDREQAAAITRDLGLDPDQAPERDVGLSLAMELRAVRHRASRGAVTRQDLDAIDRVIAALDSESY